VTTSASVTAVIPVHNRADLLDRLIASLHAQTVPSAEIVVVDNASTDGAAARARAAGCRVIGMGENAGFARAVNRGWKEAKTDWIAILNSDVELDASWIERLIGQAGSASFATGLILNAADRNRVDGTYDLVSRAACAWRAGHGELAAGKTHSGKSIVMAPGTACIFRREILASLDGFDERFGSYLEDVDLGLRCLKAGFRGAYVPDAVAWHQGSATFGRWDARVVRLTSRNQLLLVSLHYDRALFRSCLWPILVGQFLWGLVALRHGAGSAWLEGKWEALRHFRLEGSPSPQLRNFLAASEREIAARAPGPYWRWYFRLTRGAAD
jgi:GT2 family glycosyltransferase